MANDLRARLSLKSIKVPCKKTWNFGGFSYKMPIDASAMVENYPNVMINSSIFAQLFALIWGSYEISLF